ncbi:MAG: hypothetical protein IT373_14455 [Polyangiaceae bacterium]|nr:hypothetical protein [Polyangiaceae bacterium]
MALRKLSFASLILALSSALACGGGEQNEPGPSTGGVAPTGGSGGSGGATGGAPTGGSGGVGGSPCDPGATELCDGIDNNCNEQTDEGCLCVDGQTQPCYTGDPALVGVGACAEGTQTCDLQGVWGLCEGEVLPAAESCNGADDNCNLETDEGLGTVTCGLGLCQATVEACTNGQPNPCFPGTPGTELCNGSDDDCDGTVDNGCPCTDGQTQPCYSGNPATLNIGVCKAGLQTCDQFGVWGGCFGEITPLSETCDGLDNDCDNAVDQGNPGGGGACQTGLLGACSPGTRACENGALACVQTVQSSAEVCDPIDNDCDGQTNEGDPGGGAACNTGLLGLCAIGTTHCQSNQLACVQNQASAPETCDGQDNDCDGLADEGNPGGGTACQTGQQGLCAAGTTQCQLGALSCVQNVSPSAEVCDNVDNDCDGLTDEGNPGGGGVCPTGLAGVCAAGTTQCQNGTVSCVQNVPSSPEVCDNLDNDCDGSSDENNPGGGVACNTGLVGVCATGTRTCQNGALTCVQNVQSSTEVCDTLDNDCDGSADEGNPGGGTACSTGLQGVCAAGTRQCQSGTLNCVQNTASSSESCDNLDNDCDGSTDEGNPGGGASCATGLLGVCASGTRTCQAGALACVQNVSSSSEACDNLDNDCDGSVDEGNPGGGAACGTGLLGVCNAGTLTCQAGAISCVQNVSATIEVCDNLDNNCNGSVDEGDPGGGANCDTGLQGVCGPGRLHCVAGTVSCVQNVASSSEACDGVDNDCDGSTDEGNPGGGVACSTGLLGVCGAGTRQCQSGVLDCVQNVASGSEQCNDGLDNDCDGSTDEGCASCGPGTADCDSNPVNGCEVTLATNHDHCGSCPNACGAGQYCNAGVCANCGAGLRDCDQNGGNGCEIDTTSNPSNCGGCGTTCGSDGTCGCSASVCSGGTVYFSEDFSDNSRAWTLGTEWAIGSATSSSCQQQGSADPAADHSASSDNGVAGGVIGGCYAITPDHAAYYLTSPVINLSGAAGAVKLSFWRFLNTDDSIYTTTTVEVWNGTAWVVLWTNPSSTNPMDFSPDTIDAVWTRQELDVTSYKNAAFQVRFGHAISHTNYLPWVMSGWNVDDVTLASGTCN